MTVNPYADLPMTFRRVSVKEEIINGRPYTTWTGTIDAIPGSSLVAVATPGGGEHSVMVLPGSSQFAFDTTADGITTVSESQPGEEGCDEGLPNRTTTQAPTTSAIFKASYTDVLASYHIATASDTYKGSATETAVGVTAAVTASTSKVCVLIIYDSTALAAAGSADTIDGRGKAYIESGNIVLANSGITNFVWTYCGCVQTAYTVGSTSTNSAIISAISSGGSYGDWVSAQAATYSAAQVQLWFDGSKVTGIYTGASYGTGYGTPVSSAGTARSYLVWGASYKSCIHELAHNFGAHHDRANATQSSDSVTASDGDGHYCYGEMWSLTTSGGATVTASTIMGYGGAIIPYFSNPNISVDVSDSLAGGNTAIDWGTQTLGVAAGQSKAAFNAQVLIDNAATMASYGAGVVAPTIATQPASVTVTAGSSFTLSVTANGSSLSYQWKKDGSTISGATSASYTVNSAASTDAGNYTVTVSNTGGSVTSGSAAVTVNTVTPTPTSSGSSGGGGGGGAISVWCLMALAGLGLRRLRQKRASRPFSPGLI